MAGRRPLPERLKRHRRVFYLTDVQYGVLMDWMSGTGWMVPSSSPSLTPPAPVSNTDLHTPLLPMRPASQSLEASVPVERVVRRDEPSGAASAVRRVPKPVKSVLSSFDPDEDDDWQK